MRKSAFALAIILLQTSLLLAADKPSPADFTLKIHILTSRATTQVTGTVASTFQVIQTIIDGQQVELTANAAGVLALGDYPARISPTVHAPKNWSPYDTITGYDLLMPDGKTRTFTVTAISAKDKTLP